MMMRVYRPCPSTASARSTQARISGITFSTPSSCLVAATDVAEHKSVALSFKYHRMLQQLPSHVPQSLANHRGGQGRAEGQKRAHLTRVHCWSGAAPYKTFGPFLQKETHRMQLVEFELREILAHGATLATSNCKSKSQHNRTPFHFVSNIDKILQPFHTGIIQLQVTMSQ
jgi:hypothetical protein